MDGEKLQACIEACTASARQCKRCLETCIHRPDLADCVRLCRECFRSSVLCLADLRDASPGLALTCLACAIICGLCADECGKHLNDPCEHCAEASRRCAEECRKVSAAIQGHDN